jgi:hypothetical protein
MIRMMHTRQQPWFHIAAGLLILLVVGALILSAAGRLCDQGARIAVIDTK